MNKNSANKSSAGKGDRPRNCFSEKYRNNYDQINWAKKIKLSESDKKYIENINQYNDGSDIWKTS